MTASTPMPPEEHDVVEPLLAAHALATLEPHDADRVELHLAGCAACRVTFDELAAAGAWVELRAHEAAGAGGAAGEPPPSIRDEVLARARTAPQDGIQEGDGEATHHEPARTRLRRSPSSRRVGSLRRRFTAIGALGATVAALLVNAHGDQDQIASLEQRLRDAKGDQVQVLDGAQFEVPQAGDAPTRARVTLDRDSGRIVFRDVAAPPKGTVWQVWQVDEHHRISKLGVIEEATEGASLPLAGIEPDELARIFITTESAASSDREPVATDLTSGSA